MTPILLFAAGKGTRMHPLTHDRPKPLIEVAGKTLLDHALDLTADQPLGPRVVNLHYKGGMIRDHLVGQDVAFSPEETLLETGGGLRHALPVLKGSPVVTLNTDAVWRGDNPVAALLSAWRDEMDALLLVVPQDHAIGHHGRGDFALDENGKLSRGAGTIYTGLQMVRTDLLDHMPDGAFSMNLLWDKMIARGGLHGLLYDGLWCDVGQPDSIPLAERMLEGSHV
ncbi:nucleotidyltransferase family protein [Yoonia sp. 208BN28-4]|uniref:nucleotidyltransferase family protein n=1 Tax=Yoonia sp. 208BN28-4 TaxID=3126505 RepID=UPI0030A70598